MSLLTRFLSVFYRIDACHTLPPPEHIVVPAGFEPTYSESKSDVLPLDEGTIGSRYGNRTRVPRMKIWCPDP